MDRVVTKKGGIKAMMRAIETTAVVGPDGALTIDQPVDVPAGRHRVILVIDEQVVPEDMAHYPPGFFEETYGSLADDPLPLTPEGGDEHEVPG
jgi:hypothetical protein